jgi:hypothetical protein
MGHSLMFPTLQGVVWNGLEVMPTFTPTTTSYGWGGWCGGESKSVKSRWGKMTRRMSSAGGSDD